MENSPEGENGTSRIYLGIHWIFDQRDGISLGNNIAAYVATSRFQAVPEPRALHLVAIVAGLCVPRRRPTAERIFSRHEAIADQTAKIGGLTRCPTVTLLDFAI